MRTVLVGADRDHGFVVHEQSDLVVRVGGYA